MPIPLIPIAIGAAGVSLAMTAHSTLKKRKWKKIYEEALLGLQTRQKEAVAVHTVFTRTGQALGRKRIAATATISEAARYLQALVTEYQLESIPEIPNEELGEWVMLDDNIKETLAIGIGGSAASSAAALTGPALYTAAGLFGVASTGTPIASLTGAAANSARLAWLGGGAVAAGGGGIAAGSTILTVINGASLVTAPIALGLSFWAEKKAHDFENKVKSTLKQFATEETKLTTKSAIMQGSTPRMNELRNSINETNKALKALLKKGKALPGKPDQTPAENGINSPPDLEIPFQIYHTAKTLKALVEEPALTPEAIAVLES